MEIEAEDLFEQRGQRIHCDRKIYGNRRLFTGPDLVRKNVLWHKSFEGVENYINPENGQVNSYFEENMPPLKDLELDPFAMSNFVVPYSANKKKRWMIEELLAENVEEYQTETMCVSGLTQVLTALDNDIENYCVESPSNILIDVQATAFHEVVDGVPSHEYTTHKLTREVLRIPNRIPTIEDVESGEAFQEDGAYYRPPRHDYGGKIHLVYLTMKTDKRTTRINANKKISRLGSKGREDMPDFWALFFGLVEEKKTKKVVKSKKRSLVPALEDYSSLDAASEEDFPSEEETEESHSHRSSIHDLRDYIVPMVTKKKRRKHKKTKAFEDYRPVLPEVLRKETEEESTTSIPEDSAPSNVKVELLQKIVSDEVDISDGVALLPMYPFIATMKQRSGDVLVLRDGALYLNPKPEDVDESYRFCAVKLQANILLDLKTIDSMSAGPHLQVLEPRDAEKLALDLYRAEEEALRTKNFNDVAKPSVECPICLGEEFQFALSACGHFSCVDCWSNYAAHAIHDNRVPSAALPRSVPKSSRSRFFSALSTRPSFASTRSNSPTADSSRTTSSAASAARSSSTRPPVPQRRSLCANAALESAVNAAKRRTSPFPARG
ncbi:hypothetical protein L596_011635 [Steinernema carpocapsae]|uniref:RING-type domain-containing protein n=1 Tax=Steinernema carpocapsae TaxID=34508 RepID=A0A4U5NVF8_STECR|nr:hypothetical protein L596_011635 [Steinernema carpocapsae]